MKEIIQTLRKHSFSDLCSKANAGTATQEELQLLDGLSVHINDEVQSRLVHLESLAKAFQLASLDDGNEGLFDMKTDGFNFGVWLESEAATISELHFITGEANFFQKQAKEKQE